MKKLLLPILLLISLPTLAYDMTTEDQKIIDDLQPMIQGIHDDDPVRFDSILGKLSLVLTTLEKDTRVFSVLEYLDETMYQMKISYEPEEIVEIDFEALQIDVQEPVYLEPEEEEVEHEDLLDGLDEAFGYTDDDEDDTDEEEDDQDEDEEEENDSDEELADLFDDLNEIEFDDDDEDDDIDEDDDEDEEEKELTSVQQRHLERQQLQDEYERERMQYYQDEYEKNQNNNNETDSNSNDIEDEQEELELDFSDAFGALEDNNDDDNVNGDDDDTDEPYDYYQEEIGDYEVPETDDDIPADLDIYEDSVGYNVSDQGFQFDYDF